MLIQLENGKPTGYPILESNFKQLFPEISFPNPLSPNDVENLGYGLYEFSQSPEPSRYQKVVEVLPVKNNKGIWIQSWEIQEMSDSEKETADLKKGLEVRNFRNFLLSTCDWTRLDDTSLSVDLKAEWEVYRQSLRDISDQPGFPWDVQWPPKPNA